MLLLLLSLHLAFPLFSQDQNKTKKVIEEGKKLYLLEMASWKATDIFLEKIKTETKKQTGYFSYAFEGRQRCVFYSDRQEPRIVATFSFDTSFTIETTEIDTLERDMTPLEMTLYILRKQTMKEVSKDTLFELYKYTSLNLIPIVEGDERKVFILTASKSGGMIIFGNDYLLKFDDKNKVTGKQKLHKNILQMNYLMDGKNMTTGHTHLPETGDYITATDVCTLMLYGKHTGWLNHMIMGKKYITLWSFVSNDAVVTRKKDMFRAMRKIDQQRAEKKQ